jgi:hypothetical protein
LHVTDQDCEYDPAVPPIITLIAPPLLPHSYLVSHSHSGCARGLAC